jgi:hypothetical protein
VNHTPAQVKRREGKGRGLFQEPSWAVPSVTFMTELTPFIEGESGSYEGTS